MNTSDLIENLARELEPVRALPRPGTRAAAWSLGAAFYIAILAAAMSIATPGIAGAGGPLWVAQIAAVATGVLASLAAFASVIPGASRHWSIWATLAALAWLGTLLAASSWDVDWGTALAASHEWTCVGFIVVGGAPLLIVLAVMLRRGAPLHPALTAALAALAVGALANVGACVSLPHPSGAITFAWHGGVVLALMTLAAMTARLAFNWRAARTLISR